MSGEKRCYKCGITKPLTDFYRCKRSKDGRKYECSECSRQISREWQRANPEKRRANRKRWAKKNPDRMRAYRAKATERWYAQTPGARKAHKAVWYALSAGHLTRPDTCSQCERECKPQAHHPDYSKPLDVVWLCTRCHTTLHGKVAA